MKKAHPSRLDLSLLGQDLLGSDGGYSVPSSDLTRDGNTHSRVASPEKVPGGDLFVQEAKEGAESAGLIGCRKEKSGKHDGSRSLFSDDGMDTAACRIDEVKEDAKVKVLELDPAVKAFNLNPSLKAVQIDWRSKEGVERPVYNSLATIITNHFPFSNPRAKSYVKYASEVDAFDIREKFSRMPKEKPLPDKKVFTQEEKEILQKLKEGKVFDTAEEGVAALRLHSQSLHNMVIDKKAEDRRLGRKPWMLFFENEEGRIIGWDLFARYQKDHSDAFTHLHNVWHRLEEIYYDPKKPSVIL